MTRLAADEANWETASGLAVTACAQPHLRRAQIACFVRTGSRFEAPATNGLSHFLEHMIYRGTPGLPTAHAVNYAFEDLGGMLNAATYVDHAVYSVSCPPESLDATSMLFGKLLANPLFSDIETERGIVLEEILEDLDDDGNDVDADNASRRLMYPQHPLGFTITGSAATVGSFGVDDLRRHHTSHYGAGNVVLAYGGAVTLDAARKLGERDFGSMRQAARVQSPAPLAVANSPTFCMCRTKAASQNCVYVTKLQVTAPQSAPRSTCSCGLSMPVCQRASMSGSAIAAAFATKCPLATTGTKTTALSTLPQHASTAGPNKSSKRCSKSQQKSPRTALPMPSSTRPSGAPSGTRCPMPIQPKNL
jgi:predicted Zn-dependent peptidase